MKDPQRRFYIYYLLPGMKQNAGAWATSHFDPDLKIDILGSTPEQDDVANALARQIEGEIIGIWREEQFTSCNYVVLKKDGQIFINTIFKTGQVSEDKLNTKETVLGTCYYYDEGGYDNEYFIINPDGDLAFYNKEHLNFTTALKLQP